MQRAFAIYDDTNVPPQMRIQALEAITAIARAFETYSVLASRPLLLGIRKPFDEFVVEFSRTVDLAEEQLNNL